MHFQVAIIEIRIVGVCQIALSCVIIVGAGVFFVHFCNAVLAVFPLAFDRFILNDLSYFLEVFKVLKLHFDILFFLFHFLVLQGHGLKLLQLFDILSPFPPLILSVLFAVLR